MRKSDNRKGGTDRPFRKDRGSFGKGPGSRGKNTPEDREKRPDKPERRKSAPGFRKEDERRGTPGTKRTGGSEKRSFEVGERRRDGGAFRRDNDKKGSGPGTKRSGERERRSFDKDERKRDGEGFRRDSDKKERGPGAKRSGVRERRSFDDPDRRKQGADFSKVHDRKGSSDNRRGDRSGKFERDSGRDASGQRPFEKFRKNEAPRERNDARSKKTEEARRAPREDRVSRLKTKEEEGSLRRVKYDELEEGRAFSARKELPVKGRRPGKKSAQPATADSGDGMIRLNKYLSNAGVASRREADTLIQSGVVKVNGEVVTQLGHKIHPGDRVTYGDAAVRSERKVYLLLNKPKDYITTVDDPQERKTVMDLIAKACKERVYPVGRLDRNTTGLLLFTNDGELTKKLTHPKYGIKKVYHVSLNKGLKPDDFNAIAEGLELEDGPIKADDIAFVGEGKKEIGIEIHSGRNRIVRRIFEHLGYDILKLDRVAFAGLTKKDLPRGKYRFLTAKEVGFLQMIG